MDDAKLREILTALLEEMRNSKVQISDVLAQRSEYAADIRDLKASIDTTRRALDPEALGKHVADNIDGMMGQTVQKFAKGIQLNFDASTANQNAARETNQAAQDLTAKLKTLDQESRTLAAIAQNLEDRDQRSKWDWVTLAAGMILAALLAGGGAFYFAKANIKAQDFNRSVQLISQDEDAGWCNIAQAPIIADRNGLSYCAIAMPSYVAPVQDDGGE
jgi:hypothetical protein